MNNIIYHITTFNEWQNALQQGFYEASSLAIEGFIHCSKTEQVQSVLERYFVGMDELVKLNIDINRLTSPLKYELAPSVNEEFPHIYGTLNLDAVIKVEDV